MRKTHIGTSLFQIALDSSRVGNDMEGSVGLREVFSHATYCRANDHWQRNSWSCNGLLLREQSTDPCDSALLRPISL